METIKIFCKEGHLICEIRAIGGACYVEKDPHGVICYPFQREVHLGACPVCAAGDEVEKMKEEVSKVTSA